MNQDQGLHLTSEVLKTLAKAKKVLETTIYVYECSEANDDDWHKDDSSHDLYCESAHAYREICKLQDLMLGVGTIEHKYHFGEPVDVTHLRVVK